MKRIVLTLAVVVAALGVTLVGAHAASAGDYGRVPYCSAQDEQPEVATESVVAQTYEPECRPVPAVTFQDHVCGFQGYVTIPKHNGYLLDYHIGETEVDAGNHLQALGAEVHVTAEVKGDGNDEPDGHWEFTFSSPDCTGPEGPPGAPGEDGDDGEDGAPAPAPAAPTPAVPVVATPQVTG